METALADLDRAAISVAVRAWKPPVPGIREVFHARFIDHAYPPHTHDDWTLFIVDDGAIRYDLDGHGHGAGRAIVTVLPPYVVHDGRPATADGFRKRVLYLEPRVLGEDLIGPAVDRPVVPDPMLRSAISALHGTLACADDLLEAETRLGEVAARIRSSFGRHPVADDLHHRREDADALRADLDAHLFEPVTLADAAGRIGTSPTRLARSFSAVFGIAPHEYVIGRRLDAARDRILRGQPLAEVAVEVGFYDQAHLTRRFRRFMGITPGRFAADLRGDEALSARGR